MNTCSWRIDSAPATCADLSIRSGSSILSGQLYLPSRMRAAAVLHGAIGVPQRFYRHFARWLAEERGIACLTYDYRDFGASRTRPLKDSTATLADWGLEDQVAATGALVARLPGLPLWVIGHSFGGAMLPFHPSAGLERVIVIGSGLVHVADHPWPYQMLARLFWYGLGPVTVRAFGHLPGKLTGFGADLPAGVFRQWRRWCLTRGFYLTDVGGALPAPDPAVLSAPAKFVAIADDLVAPPKAVWRLMTMMPASVKRQMVLRPGAFGLASIGHLGVFERRSAGLWPAIVA